MATTTPSQPSTVRLAAAQRKLLAAEFIVGDESLAWLLEGLDDEPSPPLERVYTAKATRRSYRLLHTWNAAGLLDVATTKKRPSFRWRRFSLMDCVRLEIYFRLRKFGLSLDQLQDVKTWLAIRGLRDTETLKDLAKRDGVFLYYLGIKIMTGASVILAVYDDGKIGAGTVEQYLAAQEENGFQSHIALRLDDIYLRLMPKIKERRRPATRTIAALLSASDWHLVSVVRSGRFDAITAKTKSGAATELQLEESTDLEGMKQADVAEFMSRVTKAQTPFEDIELKSRDARGVYVKRTRRVRI